MLNSIQHLHFKAAEREHLEILVDRFRQMPDVLHEREFATELRRMGFIDEAARAYVELTKSTTMD